jgi:hypothetical protein
MPITDEEVARREACYLRAKRELVPGKEYVAQHAAEIVGVKSGTLTNATYFGKLRTARRERLSVGRCGEQHELRTIYGRDLIEYARQRWVSAVRLARALKHKRRAASAAQPEDRPQC